MSDLSPQLYPSQAPVEITQGANAHHGPAQEANLAGHKSSLMVPATIAFILIGITGLLIVAFLVVSLGPGAIAIAGFMALIPLTVVLLGIRWIDRWEPEPRSLLVFSFLWGAITSVFVALLASLVVEVLQQDAGIGEAEREILGGVIQAPLVEEFAKGLGILLIFLAARKYFDGPVDGVVYAATIAAGFAFTENILYFGRELVEGGTLGGAIGIFVVRGVMSPFAHVMFTICTGIAIGIATRRTGVAGGILAFFLGLIPAMLLHALWNGASYVVGDAFLIYYVIVQIPLFVGAIVLVVQLRKAETRTTRERLSEYAAAGWYNPDEIVALATPAGRRQALAWARARGLHLVMKGYIIDSTKLAFIRQRLISGRAAEGAQVEEAAMLAAIVARRAALTPPTY
jgi:RsiW-degrading membrane proteinase PrsW (M82 family)